jgi:RNA polymerase sigma-70 factor (ECF subfamily)
MQSGSAAEPTDIELVRAYRAGSVEAFEAIFRRYHPVIVGLTTRLVRDPLIGEDIAQETFFRVLRAIDRIDDDFNFSAWVHRIASNLCYDELRRQRRARPAAANGPRSAPLGGDREDPEEALRDIPSRDASAHPEDALTTSELRGELWRVAVKLPEKYRMILALRELQGLAYSAIATTMQISESAVETLLHRARKRFKEEYLYLGFAESRGQDRCDAAAELIANLDSLRREQRKAVREHALRCPNCGPLLLALEEPLVATGGQRLGKRPTVLASESSGQTG